MTAIDAFNQGHLDEAIEIATSQVKNNPNDANVRNMLCELLCFQGQYERADKLIETLALQQPDSAVPVSLFRQLIRGELARQECYQQGRAPELLNQPDKLVQRQLAAWLSRREGDMSRAAELLNEIEEQRPQLTGVCNGNPFDDFRDLDDFTSFFFETLTSTGKYYWIPFDTIESVTIHRPARPRDMLWLRAHMIVRNGPDGEVFLPTLYLGSSDHVQSELRLGHATDWQGGDHEPAQGAGRRIIWTGDSDLSILEIEEIDLQQA